MSDHFVGLNCTNCGAKLDVYDDMERFFCGYCGTEMVVQRRGGTINLKGVTEAIKKVQIGTDKTAAELAPVRLTEELKQLTFEATNLRTRHTSHKGLSIGLASVTIVIGFVFLITVYVTLGILMVVGGVAWLIWVWKYNPQRGRLVALDQQIAEMSSRIENLRRIADSAH
jgi:hypothetical protein